MANPKSLETSFSLNSSESAPRDFGNTVKRIAKSIDTDDRLEDHGVKFYTELVEMDDGIRYIVTTNTIESEKEREKNPADKEFPGANMLVLENTAWTTKNDYRSENGFYRKRHIANALDFHRPSMIVGVQQNWNRYVDFKHTTEDELAIYAFMAARFGYDPDYATSMGTSRGAMGAVSKQKRAPKFGQKIVHIDAMVPAVPYITDTFRMLAPMNMLLMAMNEAEAAQRLELSAEELWDMRDTIDLLTPLGFLQEAKEGIALGTSELGKVVRRSKIKDDVGHITVEKDDRMSFATKWPDIFYDHPFMNVEVRDSFAQFRKRGGHFLSVGTTYYNNWHNRAEAVADTLHAHPDNRRLGGPALRQLIDKHQAQHLKSIS